MKISIWDLDWFYKKSYIPNITCMRLSSYHKQKGDEINFIEEDFQQTLGFDIMYIVRESDTTTMPSRKLLDDKRVILFGKGFKYYGAKELSSVIVSCRPDYNLYTITEQNQYSNANFITFYANNQLIKVRQDWHNTKQNRKKTIVTDNNFWKQSDENIKYCLEVLKEEKNVAFLEPISLKKLLTNQEIQEKFLSLNFTSGTIFKWRNDFGSEYKDAETIVDFMINLRRRTKSNLGFIPFKSILLNHFTDELNLSLDLLRCFRITKLFKENKLQCLIVAPKNSWDTINYPVFKSLELWTKRFLKLSYIEYITHNITLEDGIVWYDILNTPLKWKDYKVDNLLALLSNKLFENYIDVFFIQWGYDELNRNKININFIKQNINLIYKET